MTIYSRLGFNFDINKFGDAKELPKQSIDFYKSIPLDLKDWQYNDVANSAASRSEYFRNPVADVSLNLITAANLLFQTSNGVSFENDVSTGELIPITSTNLQIEMSKFKSHTDNVSGVSSEPMYPDIPSYDMIVAVGNEITRIVVNEDNVTNTSPILGSATSLFVESDLNQYLTILTNDEALVNSSIRIETIPDPQDPNTTIQIFISNLTSQQVSSVYTNTSTTLSFVTNRRTHDWNFFKNSMDVLTDVAMVTRFTNVGSVQKTLINDYIGTEKLKNIIANT